MFLAVAGYRGRGAASASLIFVSSGENFLGLCLLFPSSTGELLSLIIKIINS